MRRRLLAIAAAVAAMVPVGAGEASASAVVAGTLSFECTATFPVFPGVSPNGTCQGEIAPALGAGPVAGTMDKGPFVIVGPGRFDATFEYSEECQLGLPPVEGRAQVSATITGMPALSNGMLVSADVQLDFGWHRLGTSAVITVESGAILLSDGGSAAITTGAGAAEIAPILRPESVCPAGANLTAPVVGSVSITAL